MLRFATVGLLFAALILSSTTLPADPFLNGSSFIVGANLPWTGDVNDGDGYFYNDLAVNPHVPGWGCEYSSSTMNTYLAALHSMGVTVVRFWINTDDQGCTLDGNGLVTGVTPLFWSNMDNLVSLASSNQISLYLTLNEGRVDWLTNSAMASAYKTNCLIPLVQRYKGSSGVFGLDLMNEIDGQVAGNDGNYSSSGATWAQAQAYISSLAAAVHSNDSNRLVSCSTGWHQWNNLGYFKGLGLDFYDFHYYADTISPPTVASLGMDKPVYIGECGQDGSDTTWSDSIQSNCELEALNNAHGGGYAGVSIWSYQMPGWQTTGYIQYAMLNTNGTWRQVCYTIQNWSAASAPVISSVSPMSGSVGTQVVITGTNFTGATAVTFNGVAASYVTNSVTQITATVPASATSGTISVTTPAGTARSPAMFTVQAGSANLLIYADGLLNEFQDYSWATDNLLNTSPVYSGSDSISVSSVQWEALWPYHDPFNTSPYASLSFWIIGSGAAGAQGLQVIGVVNNTQQSAYNLPTLPTNTWTLFNIPLSTLGVANITNCEGFWFYATAPGTATYYVDSIQLSTSQAPSLAVVSAKPSSGLFVVQLSGLSGKSYWIETSTNLVNWTIISTNILTSATANITNPVTGNPSRQFWRAYLP